MSEEFFGNSGQYTDNHHDEGGYEEPAVRPPKTKKKPKQAVLKTKPAKPQHKKMHQQQQAKKTGTGVKKTATTKHKGGTKKVKPATKHGKKKHGAGGQQRPGYRFGYDEDFVN